MTPFEEATALLAQQPPDGMSCVVCLAIDDASHLSNCPYRLLRALLDEQTRLIDNRDAWVLLATQAQQEITRLWERSKA